MGMTRERADEIVRKVIYARINVVPKMKDSEEAFHVGRMIGMMEERLKQELSNEIILKPCMEVREGKDDD